MEFPTIEMLLLDFLEALDVGTLKKTILFI